MASFSRVIPLVVASALFMENMDSTVIATSLPAIAVDLPDFPIRKGHVLSFGLIARVA